MRARLTDGYTVEDLMLAVDGCLGSKRNVEGGYIDLELICRDEQKVVQYMQWVRKKRGNTLEHDQATTDHLNAMREKGP